MTQHFDNLTHYTEDDFDDYLYYSSRYKKSYYEDELKQFYFVYQDAWGEEYELFTTIQCTYKVTPGTFSYMAESDYDYFGNVELTAWKVLSVENNEGDEVKPEDVLTEKQLLAYTAGLETFIEE